MKAKHLKAASGTLANFRNKMLRTGGFRVGAEPYDESKAAAQQGRKALWHRFCALLHNGDTDNDVVREAFARMQSVGERMFVEMPHWYETTVFLFMMNRTAEKYVDDHHVRRYQVEPTWGAMDGAGVIHTHHACKVTRDGVPLPEGVRYSWDGGGSGDSSGGRQYVAGAVACYLFWKIGYPLRVGGFPLMQDGGGIGGEPIKITVGKGKTHGDLRPGHLVIPIGTEPWPHLIGGVEQEALVVECPEFGVDPDTGSFPTAIIPPLFYESAEIRGVKVYWVQWPIKYAYVNTGHSLTGQERLRLMMSFEYFWCHGAVFSGVTRAREPPPKVGEPLTDLEGAIGIMLLNKANGRVFDPSYMALGLAGGV